MQKDNAPDTIHWQGQELFLSESKSLKGVIGKPTRYVYVDSGGVTKLMQYQFSNNPPIDWQTLEAENTAPARRDFSRIRSTKPRMSDDMRRAWQRDWWAKNKAEQNRKRRERSRLQREGNAS